MNTKIVRMDEEQIEEEVIQRAGQIIRSGGLVAVSYGNGVRAGRGCA